MEKKYNNSLSFFGKAELKEGNKIRIITNEGNTSSYIERGNISKTGIHLFSIS